MGLSSKLDRLRHVLAGGGEAEELVGRFLDELLAILDLDFVRVRLGDSTGGLEVTRQAREASPPSTPVVSIRLGIQTHFGMLDVGSLRPAFPDDVERLFLDAAASQLTVTLHEERARKTA